MHQRRKDGTYNVKIRITHLRQSKYIPTSIYVTDAQVTRSGTITDFAVLDSVDALIREIRGEITGFAYKIDKLSVEEVIVEIKRQRAAKEPIHFPLFKFAREHYGGKEQYSRMSDEVAFRSFERFLGHDPDISEIRPKLIRKYIEWLQTDQGKCRGDSDLKGQKRMKAKSPATVERYVSSIRWAFNEARKEYNDYDDGIIKIDGNPFEFIELPEKKTAAHRSLGIGQIQSIVDCQPTTEMGVLARDMFLISIGLQGMNLRDIADIDVRDGYCEYRRHKVRSRTDAKMTCRIEPEIMPILERHLVDGHFSHKYPTYHNLLANVTVGMRHISQQLGFKATMYSARHSWATLARNECGGDKWTVHEALLHSSRDTAIDDIYIRPDYSRIWELNRKVIELFDFTK